MLNELKEYCGGDREIMISRELTKKFEEHIGYNINEVIDFFKKETILTIDFGINLESGFKINLYLPLPIFMALLISEVYPLFRELDIKRTLLKFFLIKFWDPSFEKLSTMITS